MYAEIFVIAFTILSINDKSVKAKYFLAEPKLVDVLKILFKDYPFLSGKSFIEFGHT